jgi:hypothetical protein
LAPEYNEFTPNSADYYSVSGAISELMAIFDIKEEEL